VAVLCAALAMLSKEHGVIVGVVILLDKWLHRTDERPYPTGFWIALAIVTIGFLAAWIAVGRAGENSAAAVFYGRGMWGRLAIALPAVLRAALLLVWPASLSVDYNPQVLSARDGISIPAVLGLVVVVGIPALVLWCRPRAPAISFAAGVAALSYLPTTNIFFSSGVILAERNLYLAAILPAVCVGWATSWLAARRGLRLAAVAVVILAIACGWRSAVRLPAWRDNRSQLLTLLADHPESYWAHGSAASVLAGTGDTAGARREYRIADSLFSGDPYFNSARAIFLIGIGDTAAAGPLVDRGKRSRAGERVTLRATFLLELARGHRTEATAVADSASKRWPSEQNWYLRFRQ
jgi:hypothetical protein